MYYTAAQRSYNELDHTRLLAVYRAFDPILLIVMFTKNFILNACPQYLQGSGFNTAVNNTNKDLDSSTAVHNTYKAPDPIWLLTVLTLIWIQQGSSKYLHGSGSNTAVHNTKKDLDQTTAVHSI